MQFHSTLSAILLGIAAIGLFTFAAGATRHAKSVLLALAGSVVVAYVNGRRFAKKPPRICARLTSNGSRKIPRNSPSSHHSTRGGESKWPESIGTFRRLHKRMRQ